MQCQSLIYNVYLDHRIYLAVFVGIFSRSCLSVEPFYGLAWWEQCY